MRFPWIRPAPSFLDDNTHAARLDHVPLQHQPTAAPHHCGRVETLHAADQATARDDDVVSRPDVNRRGAVGLQFRASQAHPRLLPIDNEALAVFPERAAGDAHRVAAPHMDPDRAVVRRAARENAPGAPFYLQSLDLILDEEPRAHREGEAVGEADEVVLAEMEPDALLQRARHRPHVPHLDVPQSRDVPRTRDPHAHIAYRHHEHVLDVQPPHVVRAIGEDPIPRVPYAHVAHEAADPGDEDRGWAAFGFHPLPIIGDVQALDRAAREEVDCGPVAVHGKDGR